MRAWPTLILPAFTLVHCSPTQPEGYCSDNSECSAYHLCDPFTRRCRITIGYRGDDAKAWGEFLCFERFDTSALGYFTLTLDPEFARSLGAAVDPDSTFAVSRGNCITQVSSGLRVVAYRFSPGDQTTYDVNLILSPDMASSGGYQSGAVSPYPLVSFQIGSTLIRGLFGGTVDISTYEESSDPPYIRGEFVGKDAR